MRAQVTDGLVKVLELVPELGEGLSETDFDDACSALRARFLSLPAGRLDLTSAIDARSAAFGVLILDGIVCREVQLRDQHVMELLGPGDVVVRAPDELSELELGASTTTAVRDLLAVELGSAFVRCAARWPGLMTALVDRLEQQHQRLVAQELIVHLRRADERLLLMLWLLANRWGYVTPEGIHVPLSMTHDLLGQLIAAKRPTVSLAVRELEKGNLLKRLPGGSWLISLPAEALVRRIARTREVAPVGEGLRLRQRAMELQSGATALRASARLTADRQIRPRPSGDGASPDGSSGLNNEAARSASKGATNARRRGRAAATRGAELAVGANPMGQPQQAATRARDAAQAAEIALARASYARARAASSRDGGSPGDAAAASRDGGSPGDAAVPPLDAE
jgi:CRP-like cAMP-binding protein